MIKKFIQLTILIILISSCNTSKTIDVTSPDGEKVFSFLPSSVSNEGIKFIARNGKNTIFLPSSLKLSSPDLDLSGPFEVEKIQDTSVRNTWHSKYSELSTIPDNYNQIKIFLKSSKASLNLICRAYNEGIAFSYEILPQNGIKQIGIDENIQYNFDQDYSVWSTPKREKNVLTAQGLYRKIKLSQLEKGCERPLLIEMGDSLRIALTEAKLVDYARTSFQAGTTSQYSILSTIDGKLGKMMQDTITGAISATRLEGVKVHKTLPFQSPWRVVMVGKNVGELLENNYIIQNLNDPCAIKDASWIKPGKMLRETTLTTKGAYAAIDFVASHNMQYVLFDAGWYGNEMDNASDATTPTLDSHRSKGPFDLKSIVSYAKKNNIGIILYVNRRALEKQLDEILPLYKKWGIAGIKFGFVRVGDQDATRWLHMAIKKAAQYGLVVDVHDEYRPTGFSRAYPNLLSQEGIRGDETTITNHNTLINMFTRMLAGAADNTICYYNSRVEKMGSHASQLAKSVCIFSPLQSLYWYDKPAASPEKIDGLWGDTRHIGNEPELEFFNTVPTTWDETKVLTAEIGEIGIIARRRGNDWWIGGINGETAREVEVDFSFLKKGANYAAKIYTDDEKVHTRTHVRIKAMEITKSTKMTLNIKANNGFVMHLIQQ